MVVCIPMHNNDMQGEDQKVYEIGYLMVPTVPEEHLAAEVGNIKSMLESQGAAFISEEFPKLRGLAYSISKKIDGVRRTFETAYFGWVKFDLPTEKMAAIKEALERNNSVIRFLLVKTVRENTLVGVKALERKAKEGEEGTAEEKKEAPKLTEAEIDKTIENLVIQ